MKTLALYQKVRVRVPKIMAPDKMVEMTLMVCGTDTDENGEVFYWGWTEKGGTRYFRIKNLID